MGAVAAGTAAPVEARPAEKRVETTTEKKSPQAKYQRQARKATNAQRTSRGISAVRRGDCVQRFAARQARKMAQQERMFHQDLAPVLAECGLVAAGENVAYGYPNGRSVVNDGWMSSPGHRLNILNPVYRVMGLGARKGHDGKWYVAQVFGTSL